MIIWILLLLQVFLSSLNSKENVRITSEKKYKAFEKSNDKILTEKHGSNEVMHFVLQQGKQCTRLFKDSLKVQIHFGSQEATFYLMNDSLFISSNDFFSDIPVNQLDPYTYEFYTPPASYSLMIYYNDLVPVHYILDESVVFQNDTIMQFSEADANRTVVFDARDEFNNNFPNNESKFHIKYRVTLPGRFTISTYCKEGNIKVSDFSGAIKIISMHTFIQKENDIDCIRKVRFPILSELYSDTLLTNQPSDLNEYFLTYRFSPVSMNRTILPYEPLTNNAFQTTVSYSLINTYPVEGEIWFGRLLINDEQDSDYISTLDIQASMTYEPNPLTEYLSYFPLRIFNKNLCSFQGYYPSLSTYMVSPGDTLKFGIAPIYANGLHLNNFENKTIIKIKSEFFGNSNNKRSLDVGQSTLKIKSSDNSVLYSGILSDFDTMSVIPGKYFTEIVNNNYYIKDIKGNAILNSEYNLEKNDPNPPVLTSLQVFNSESKAREEVWDDEDITIRFSAGDIFFKDSLINNNIYDLVKYKRIMTDSTKLMIKNHSDSIWLELPINLISEESEQYRLLGIYSFRYYESNSFRFFPRGVIYETKFTDLKSLNTTAIDLKIEIQDDNNNKLSWILEPAILVRERPTDISKVINIISRKFEMHQNYPNPFNPKTTITFYLPNRTNIEIFLYNVIGEIVEVIYQGEYLAGDHSIVYDGKDLASGIYFYQLRTDTFISTRKCIFIK
jgi:hypothetical protein